MQGLLAQGASSETMFGVLICRSRAGWSNWPFHVTYSTVSRGGDIHFDMLKVLPSPDLLENGCSEKMRADAADQERLGGTVRDADAARLLNEVFGSLAVLCPDPMSTARKLYRASRTPRTWTYRDFTHPYSNQDFKVGLHAVLRLTDLVPPGLDDEIAVLSHAQAYRDLQRACRLLAFQP